MERANLVIVGEFVALDADAYGEDGYASTITFKVGEVFKGTAPPTGKVHLRQESGMTGWVAEGRIFSVTPGDIATMSKSAPEFVGPPKGTKYVLYLSDTLYSRPAVAAKHKTMTRGGPYYLSVDDTYRLSDDGRLLPTEGRCWVAVKSLTTLAEVRAAAARYKSRALQSETGRLPN